MFPWTLYTVKFIRNLRWRYLWMDTNCSVGLQSCQGRSDYRDVDYKDEEDGILV